MSSGIGQHENDKRWMRAALAEARKAEGRTGTNPPVGCVLISPDNKLISAGHTKPNGRPHAEAVALAEAGSAGLAHRVVGATAYVTLEPCAHHGKTPPCAEAMLALPALSMLLTIRMNGLMARGLRVCVRHLLK